MGIIQYWVCSNVEKRQIRLELQGIIMVNHNLLQIRNKRDDYLSRIFEDRVFVN